MDVSILSEDNKQKDYKIKSYEKIILQDKKSIDNLRSKLVDLSVVPSSIAMPSLPNKISLGPRSTLNKYNYKDKENDDQAI